MKCPFCGEYIRLADVPFHQKCLEKQDVEERPDEILRRREAVKGTTALIQSILQSRIARARMADPKRR